MSCFVCVCPHNCVEMRCVHRFSFCALQSDYLSRFCFFDCVIFCMVLLCVVSVCVYCVCGCCCLLINCYLCALLGRLFLFWVFVLVCVCACVCVYGVDCILAAGSSWFVLVDDSTPDALYYYTYQQTISGYVHSYIAFNSVASARVRVFASVRTY